MFLDTDEIIVKETLPWKSFFFNMTEIIRIVFSFFYLEISVLFLLNLTSFLFFFGVFLFIVALYLCFFRWILKYFDLKNHYYLITNQRIMIARKSNKEVLKYKKLEDIQMINLQMNNTYFGNIIFGQPEGILGRSDEPFVLGKRYGMNFKEDEYDFLSVENINEIIPILEKLGLRVNKTFY